MAFIYDLADTWNAAGTTFTAIKMNVTDTASAAGSLLMDLQVGGVSRFRVAKTGAINSTGWIRSSDAIGDDNGAAAIFSGNFVLSSTKSVSFTSGSFYYNTQDTFLTRDAANTLAQRNGVNAQAFRWYQSFTDASNYTRGAVSAAGGIITLAGESAGTGAADIDVALTPKGAGQVRYGTHTAISDTAVTGYIEIKDAGGTLRRLAVVS